MAFFVDSEGGVHSSIEINGTDAFILEVTAAMREIQSIDRVDAGGTRCSDPGPRLILGLSRANNKVTIAQGSTFKATAGGDTDKQFARLKVLWGKNQHDNVRQELRVAMPKAGFSSIEVFAQRLAASSFAIVDRAFTNEQLQGKSPEQVESLLGGKAGNILTPTSNTLVDPRVAPKLFTTKSGRAMQEFNNRQGNVDSWVKTLKEYLNGQSVYNPTPVALRTILLLLEPGLTPSDGCNATVMYAPASLKATCAFDSAATARPKAIAFAHELLHAYYIVKGNRIFNESTIEDELLTAGLPPFHFRDLSENRFRANWTTEQPIRQYYKFGTVGLDTACAFCGKMQSAMKRGNRGFEDNCETCGKPLPARTQ